MAETLATVSEEIQLNLDVLAPASKVEALEVRGVPPMAGNANVVGLFVGFPA
jgi:hypothetical protein